MNVLNYYKKKKNIYDKYNLIDLLVDTIEYICLLKYRLNIISCIILIIITSC